MKNQHKNSLQKSFVVRSFLILLFIFIAISSCNNKQENNELAQLVPDQTFAPNWRQDGEPESYGPENLFEYIDGQAEIYLDYGFNELYTINFRYREREDETLTIDVYDLGSPINAWGLYSVMRRPGYRFQEIGGAEAVVSTYQVRFAKDTKLVQVTTATKAEHVFKDMVKIATMIAEKIPTGVPPNELSLLPKEGQVEHTIKYVVKGFLGQTFLPPLMEAGYQGTNNRFSGFVVPYAAVDSAKSGIIKFKDFISSRGEISDHFNNDLGVGIWAHLPYHGNLLVSQNGEYITGVHHADTREEGEMLLKKILAGLK